MRPRERPAETSAGASRAIGELIAGRYFVEQRLGAGGMGSVYKVFDQSTKRTLALKELGGRVAKQDATEGQRLRFRREFHTMAQLKHPRIVEVYEFGLDGAKPYYTMEILEGKDLRDLGHLDLATSCAILRDVASALAFLHARRLVHRDVAPRNVRCASDGGRLRAKLIDFGVIATPGIVGDIAGTPRYISPENVRGLPLDHRADVYSLGALAYWLLSGKDAYGAHRIDDLEEAWRKKPASLSSLVEGVPQALDDLVMSMLSLDPLARPASAAEVIDRLVAIGGLAPEPEIEAARGYLASAALVGRQREMDLVRRRVSKAALGEGGVVVVEAPSGAGKSRLLRETALEGQVAGMSVVSAGSDASGRGPYGVVAALARALMTVAPRDALEAARPRAPVLARVLPEPLARLGPVAVAAPLGDPSEERGRAQSEIVRWLLDVAARRPLLFVVDDAQRADEASAAVLAALAHAALSEHVLVVAAVRTDEAVRAPAALAALRDVAVRVRLGGLKPKDVEALVRGMFGDAPGLTKVAAWVQKLAGSSPFYCIELLRQLVDAGTIRFKDGIWSLPEEAPADVPKGLAEAMEARVHGLSPRARALAEALSVHGGEIPLALAVHLAEAPESEVFVALDELLYQETLVGTGASYRFRHEGVREAILRKMDPERKKRLHLAVGHALTEKGEVPIEREAEVGWHLLEGGERARGGELLARAGTRLYEAQSFHDAVAPLEAALKVFEAEGKKARDVLELRHMLIMVGAMSDREVTLRYGPDTIAVLHKGSGIERAARLRRVLPPRLAVVLGIAFAFVAWLFARPSKKGPSPLVAMTRFYIEVAYTAVAYSLSFDTDGVRRLLVLLEPLRVFKNRMPAGSYLLVRNLLAMPLGEWDLARKNSREILRILGIDHVTPLTEMDRKNAHGAAYYILAIVAALSQENDCAEAIARLRGLNMRYFDVCALIALMTYHRFRGEEDQALEAQREIELFLVQLGSMWGPESTLHWISSLAYGLTRDVLGLRRSIDELERLVRAGYAVGHFLDLARGEYYRERGELDEARRALERALASLEREEGFARPAILGALAETLLAQHHFVRAKETAQRVLDFEEGPDRKERTWRLRAERILAMVDAATGDLPAAARRLDRAIDEAAALKSPSLCGMLHEARARVAQAAADAGLMAIHRRAAESWYRGTKNPALVARVGRLPAASDVDAHEASDAPTMAERTAAESPLARGAGELSVLTDEPITIAEGSEASWVSGILRGCRGPSERAERALDLLVVACGGASGYLFLAKDGALQLAAPLHGNEPEEQLALSLHRAARDAGPGAESPVTLHDDHARVILKVERRGQPTVVGIAAITPRASAVFTRPSPRLVGQVARELHDAGDVSVGSFTT